jgi:hypothetical protein
VRVRDLAGWPPSCFKSTELPPRDYAPLRAERLRIQSVMFMPGLRGMKGPGELRLLLRCRDTGDFCFAPLQVRNADLGRRVARVLSKCRGSSLGQAGLRAIATKARPKAAARS